MSILKSYKPSMKIRVEKQSQSLIGVLKPFDDKRKKYVPTALYGAEKLTQACQAAEDRLKKLGVPKSSRKGAVIEVYFGGDGYRYGKGGSTYSHAPASYRLICERFSSGWFLTDLRESAGRSDSWCFVNLSMTARQKIRENMDSEYRVAFSSAAEISHTK